MITIFNAWTSNTESRAEEPVRPVRPRPDHFVFFDFSLRMTLRMRMRSNETHACIAALKWHRALLLSVLESQAHDRDFLMLPNGQTNPCSSIFQSVSSVNKDCQSLFSSGSAGSRGSTGSFGSCGSAGFRGSLGSRGSCGSASSAGFLGSCVSSGS